MGMFVAEMGDYALSLNSTGEKSSYKFEVNNCIEATILLPE